MDSPTMLYLTLGIAAIVSNFLTFEWRALREPALKTWAIAFGLIVLGCSISPLRQHFSPLIGLWLANGLLIVAHLAFLRGVCEFLKRPISIWWWATLLPWLVLCPFVYDHDHLKLLACVNAASVGLLALICGWLLLRRVRCNVVQTALGWVFSLHGIFYAGKASVAFLSGAFTNPLRFEGVAIQVSLFWGIMIEITLALLMTAIVRHRHEATIVELTERDPLTGMFNRRAFEARALPLLASAAKAKAPISVLLFDLDHFKVINDTHGHAVGDRVLISFANLVERGLHSNALFARLGGEEFIAVIPNMSGKEVEAFGNTVCRLFDASGAVVGDEVISTTVSAGIAMSPEGSSDLASLMKQADDALYTAKRTGRNRVCFEVVAGPSEAQISGASIAADLMRLAKTTSPSVLAVLPLS